MRSTELYASVTPVSKKAYKYSPLAATIQNRKKAISPR